MDITSILILIGVVGGVLYLLLPKILGGKTGSPAPVSRQSQQPITVPTQPSQTPVIQNPPQQAVSATPNTPPSNDNRVIPIGFLITALIATGLGGLNQYVEPGV